MKPAFSEAELKSTISSSLRRQHLLGAVPAAQRFLPLTALAIGDVLAQRSGNNVIENLLCGSEGTVGTDSQIKLPEQAKERLRRDMGKRSMSTVVESCRTCWFQGQHHYHRGVLAFGNLDGFRIGRTGNLWHPAGGRLLPARLRPTEVNI